MVKGTIIEEKNGFKYSFIQDVIDQKPLLNQELQELANYLSKIYM